MAFISDAPAKVVLADLRAAIGAGANVIGVFTQADLDTVVIRDRWNQRAVVEVTDHPDYNATTNPIRYESASLGAPWILGGSKLGNQSVEDAAQTADNEVIYPA